METDPAQPREEVLAGGTDVGGADGVEGAVGDGPADQHGRDDRERGGVPPDQHRERVQQQHAPHRDPPTGPPGHPHRRHIGDHGRQIAVHRSGEGTVVQGLGQRVPDGGRSGLGHPQVGGQRHPVGEDGGQHPVRDPQPVPLDQPLDGERHRHDQHRDAGGQPGQIDQQRGRRLRAAADVVLQALGGAVGERGEPEDERDPGDAEQQPQQVGGPVHPRGQQRLVAGDPVDMELAVLVGAQIGTVRARTGLAPGRAGRLLLALVVPDLLLLRLSALPLLLLPLGWLGLPGPFRPLGRPGSFGLLDRARLFGSGSRGRLPLVLPLWCHLLPLGALGHSGRYGRGAGGVDGQRLRGARLPWRRCTLLLGRLFLISYHQSPSGRWWHDRPVEEGIRVHFGGAGSATSSPHHG